MSSLLLSKIARASLFVLMTLIGVAKPVQSSEVSLTDIPCSTTSAASGFNSWSVGQREASIGREIYDSVAILQYGRMLFGYSYIPEGELAGVACRITPSGATPRFSTLRLAFGMAAENEYTENTTLMRLDIFVDGNQVDSVQFDRYTPGYSIVDVSNARSIALEATCLSSGWCPGISFVQTLLE